MVTSTTGVFVTADTETLFHFHFSRCGLLSNVIYTNRDEFVSSHHSCKVVCLQMPYPIEAAFDDDLQYFANNADSVLVLVSELHNNTVSILRRNDRKNIIYFVCGELNTPLAHSPVHKFYDWLTTTVHFYRNVRPSTLDILTPYSPKPLMFDVLLGRKKIHRKFAYDYIESHNLMDKNIVTYLDSVNNCNLANTTSDKWIWEKDGLEINQNIEWTVERFPYYGHRMSISQVIPLTIYNQTAYSIVAETNWENYYSFYTEKTVKPIIGRRLFVMLAGQFHLRNLRNIGFKTFDTIIDETYDNTEDNTARFGQAMDQVRYLCNQPQEEILDKIKPIVDHNFTVMMSTDWYNVYFKPAFISYFNQ